MFRVVGRDDVQGRIAGDLLAERWGDKPIAILHDGQAYGKGLAEETRKRLNERGIAEAMFEAIEPGKADYWDIVQKMQAKGIEVLYYGGYQHEAGLIIRQAREHGYELQLRRGRWHQHRGFRADRRPGLGRDAHDAILRSRVGPEAAELQRQVHRA